MQKLLLVAVAHFSYICFSIKGIIIARLKGLCSHSFSTSFEAEGCCFDTIIANARRNNYFRDPFYNEVILRQSCQAVPLATFPSINSGRESHLIYNLHMELQRVIDRHLNNGSHTAIGHELSLDEF